MPAIKLKKAAADHQAEKDRERERAEEENRPVVPSPLGDGGDQVQGEVRAPRPPKEPYKSFLDGDILTEKRRRYVPVADRELDNWLTEHVESKPETRLNLQQLFDYYRDFCQQTSTPVIHFQGFCQVMRKRFGQTFALKATSPLKGMLKELKVKPKSAAAPGTQKLKMSDVITEALVGLNSGKKGSSFMKIKQFATARHPVLHSRGKVLKRALERAVLFGKVDLVRGVGYCGYYRLPGNYESEDEEKTEGTESQDEGSAEGDAAKNGESEDKEKSKSEDGEKSEEKKKKKKRPHSTKPMTVKRNRHANPFRIEDTFPLALTFMSEPKAASVSKIRRYLMEHYPDCNVDARLKRALERGEERGLWQRVSGTGAGSGTYRLLIQEFNPSLHDSIDDMICSALIACNEPKQASTSSVKQYIQEYHTNFNLNAKPHLLKLALERAINGGLIVRVSGIGMTGSLQLVKPFTPTPAMLAGEELDSEEEEEDEAEAEYIPRATKSRRGGSTKAAQQKRATPASKSRSRKRARQDDSSEEEDEPQQMYVPKKSRSRGGSAARAPAKAAPKRKAPRDRSAPAPAKRSKGSAKAAGKSSRQTQRAAPARARAATASAPEVSEEEGREEMAEYTPRKSKSRGGGGGGDAKKSSSASRKSQGGREESRKKPASYREDSDEGDDAPEYTPQKSRSRGGSLGKRPEPQADKKKSSSSSSSKRPQQVPKAAPAKAAESSDEEVELFEEEEEEEEYTPRKSKSRSVEERGDAKMSASASRKSHGGKEESRKRHAMYREDSDEGEEPEYTPQKSRSRGGSHGQRPGAHTEEAENEGGNTSSFTTPKTKKQKAAASHRT